MNFDSESGWTSEQARDDWAAEAVGLESEVRAALAGKAELTVDLSADQAGASLNAGLGRTRYGPVQVESAQGE